MGIFDFLTGEFIDVIHWVDDTRDLGAMVFVTLRDRAGIVQVRFEPHIDEASYDLSKQLRAEWCVAIQGTLASRGENANDDMPTGAQVDAFLEERSRA